MRCFTRPTHRPRHAASGRRPRSKPVRPQCCRYFTANGRAVNCAPPAGPAGEPAPAARRRTENALGLPAPARNDRTRTKPSGAGRMVAGLHPERCRQPPHEPSPPACPLPPLRGLSPPATVTVELGLRARSARGGGYHHPEVPQSGSPLTRDKLPPARRAGEAWRTKNRPRIATGLGEKPRIRPDLSGGAARGPVRPEPAGPAAPARG